MIFRKSNKILPTTPPVLKAYDNPPIITKNKKY